MPKVASGFLCFGPSFFASAAFILSIFANARCNLVNPAAEPSYNPAYMDLGLSASFVGLWCYEAENSYNYSIENLYIDSKWEAARGCGTATMALGFCIWLFYLFAACCRFGPMVFRAVGFLGVITCMMQGLVFLVFQSSVCAAGCTLGVGGNCAIAACVLWFFAGVFSCGAGKEAEAAQEAQEAQGE